MVSRKEPVAQAAQWAATESIIEKKKRHKGKHQERTTTSTHRRSHPQPQTKLTD